MPDFHSSHAVVIGIDAYGSGIPPLRTAVADARRLAGILAGPDYGYTVRCLFDEQATRAALETMIATTLKAALGPDDRVLVYFAGHGIAMDGDDGPAGYLVPQDARLEDRATFLPMTRLNAWLNDLPCRHLLLILDCCFAGAFRWTSTRNLVPVPDVIHRERYDRFLRDPAWQVLTSAAYDQRALDQLAGDDKRGLAVEGDGDHSPFAQALFAALAGPGDVVPRGEGDGVITATELYLYLRDAVEVQAEEQAGHRQTPGLWPLKKHDKGEYIFLVPGHPLNLPPAPPLSAETNPWRGLESYDEQHGGLFFGREDEIEELAALIRGQPFTAVLGASGTGKSSLVKAGLVPRLRRDTGQAGAEGAPWLILPPMRPTVRPIQALHRLLAGSLPVAPGALDTDPNALADALAAWRPDRPGRKLFLVVDQLEELITLCRGEAERRQFLSLLARAVAQQPDILRLAITLRTDFEPQLARDTPLAAAWAAGGARYVVPPMDYDDLRQAVEGPAAARVLFLEPYELVDELATEVIQTPGALPLLSFTLSEMYARYLGRQEQARRTGKTVERSLTGDDYRALGGVVGSLRSRATAEYDALPDDAHRQTMRRVLLRLVAVEGGELALRRAARSELEYPDDGENRRVDEVIRRLVAARLVVQGREEGGEAYVEPAHDALVRAWDRLLAWKAEAEESLPLQRRVAQAAVEWEAASGPERAGLLWDDDPRLPQLEALLWPARQGESGLRKRLEHLRQFVSPDAGHPRATAWLNRREVQFTQRSVARRAAILRRIAGTGLAAIALLAALLMVALWQGQLARTEAGHARLAESTAEVRRVAAEDARATAQSEATRALNAEGTAQAEARNARQAQSTAEARRVEAVNAQATAVAEADRAQRTLVGQVASLSQIAAERNLPQQAALLAVEAANTYSPTLPAAYGALHNAINGTGGIGLRGHTDTVWAVAFSPDGRRLATGSADGTARLWDVQDPGAGPAVLRGHDDWIRALTFSPDGRWLATAGYDHTVRLWDMLDPGGSPIVLEGHDLWVSAVAFSPDGRWLATGGGDNLARVWNVLNPQAKPAVLSGHTLWINAVAFSPDGHWLATASRDGTARLWDVQNLEAEPAVLSGHADGVNALAFSPDGRRLATGGGDGAVRLWEVRSPAAGPAVLTGHEGSVGALAFSPDGRWLATGAYQDGNARLWDMSNPGADPILLSGHEGTVETVVFSPDGRRLATGSDDNNARLWDLRQPGAAPVVLRGHEGDVIAAAFSPDGRRLATGCFGDNTPRLWDVWFPETEPVVLREHTGKVQAVAFSPDGNRLATGDGAGVIRLWDQRDPTSPLEELPGLQGAILSMAYSPDARWLAASAADGTARVWNAQTLAVQLEVQAGEGSSIALAFSPDGHLLATGCKGFLPTLWDVENPGADPIALGSEETSGEAIAFSPNGRWLATTSRDGNTVRLWPLSSGSSGDPFPRTEPVSLHGHESTIRVMAFSPDGRLLATGSYDDTARLWDMRNLAAEPILLRGHTLWIRAVAFSPDGRWLATGSGDNTARLWDLQDPATPTLVVERYAGLDGAVAFSPDSRWLATTNLGRTAQVWDVQNPGARPIVVSGHAGGLYALAFSPDGLRLATGSDDGTARLWTVPLGAAIEQACRMAGRNLTQAEWDTYFQGRPYRCTCPGLPPGAGAPADVCASAPTGPAQP